MSIATEHRIRNTELDQLDKVRNDLEEAQSNIIRTWCTPDGDDPMRTVNLSIEALLRAVSTLTLIVEHEQKYRQNLTGRVNYMEWDQ